MTNKQKLELILERVQHGPRFFRIKYATEESCDWRTIQLGADMRKAFSKRVGAPNGKGNWHTGRTGGKGYGTIYSEEVQLAPYCIRGIDMGDDVAKIFKLESCWACIFDGEKLW